jgi:hypothetical protein
MVAVEQGDWDVARGRIREAKEMLARAGLRDLERTPSGAPSSDSSAKIVHLSAMVRQSPLCDR